MGPCGNGSYQPIANRLDPRLGKVLHKACGLHCSEDFMQQPLLQNLRWLRMVGDTIMILVALAFFWQIVKVLSQRNQ